MRTTRIDRGVHVQFKADKLDKWPDDARKSGGCGKQYSAAEVDFSVCPNDKVRDAHVRSITNSEGSLGEPVDYPSGDHTFPHVKFAASDSQYYTVLMVNLMNPYMSNAAEKLHWCVSNIKATKGMGHTEEPGLEATRSTYLPPARKDALYGQYDRYAFLVFEHDSMISAAPLEGTDLKQWLNESALSDLHLRGANWMRVMSTPMGATSATSESNMCKKFNSDGEDLVDEIDNDDCRAYTVQADSDEHGFPIIAALIMLASMVVAFGGGVMLDRRNAEGSA